MKRVVEVILEALNNTETDSGWDEYPKALPLPDKKLFHITNPNSCYGTPGLFISGLGNFNSTRDVYNPCLKVNGHLSTISTWRIHRAIGRKIGRAKKIRQENEKKKFRDFLSCL